MKGLKFPDGRYWFETIHEYGNQEVDWVEES
jgi:hypothetical protein